MNVEDLERAIDAWWQTADVEHKTDLYDREDDERERLFVQRWSPETEERGW